MADSVQVVRRDRLEEVSLTPGMARNVAALGDHVMVLVSRVQPRMVPGWHHHGEYMAVVYVQAGTMRVEFAEEGREPVDLNAGDFYRLPPGTVHRESNPGDEALGAVSFVLGPEYTVVNVAGPDRHQASSVH